MHAHGILKEDYRDNTIKKAIESQKGKRRNEARETTPFPQK